MHEKDAGPQRDLEGSRLQRWRRSGGRGGAGMNSALASTAYARATRCLITPAARTIPVLTKEGMVLPATGAQQWVSSALLELCSEDEQTCQLAWIVQQCLE
eukprot:3646527-Rhodomonas_salina.4